MLSDRFHGRDKGSTQPLTWTIKPKEMNTWWRHQMATFAALLAPCEGNSPVTGKFPSQRPVKRSFIFLSAPWINNREAGDLRRHRAHYDVIVMNELSPVAHIQQFCYLHNQRPVRYMHTCLPVTVGNWRPGAGWLKIHQITVIRSMGTNCTSKYTGVI